MSKDLNDNVVNRCKGLKETFQAEGHSGTKTLMGGHRLGMLKQSVRCGWSVTFSGTTVMGEGEGWSQIMYGLNTCKEVWILFYVQWQAIGVFSRGVINLAYILKRSR